MFVMKKNSLVIAFALLSSINAVSATWDPTKDSCDKCDKTGDNWAKCLQNHCYGKNVECLTYFPSADSLSICCDMDFDCIETSTKIDKCLSDCLPSCVDSTISNYMSCTGYRSSTTTGCDVEDCMTKIVLDRDWLAEGDSLSNSNKFLQKLGDDLQEKKYFGYDGCVSTEQKVAEVCEIGETCCDNCNSQLSDVMDCVVNEVVREWMNFDDDCKTGCSDVRSRKLQSSDVFTTGNATLDKELAEKSIEQTAGCKNNFNMQILLGVGDENATSAEWGPKAGEDLMNCALIAGINATVATNATATATAEELEDSHDHEGHDHSSHGSSSATNGLIFLSFAASLVALNNIALN